MAITKWLLVIVASLAAAGTVSAQEAPRWSYIEAGFTDFNPDSGNSDNGGFAGGSIGIFNNFHLLAEYDWIGDYDLWNAGVGWHGLLGDPMDLYAKVTWRDVSSSPARTTSRTAACRTQQASAGCSASASSSRARPPGPISIIARRSTGLEGLFFLMENRLGLGASWALGDADTLRLFARWNFGT